MDKNTIIVSEQDVAANDIRVESETFEFHNKSHPVLSDVPSNVEWVPLKPGSRGIAEFAAGDKVLYSVKREGRGQYQVHVTVKTPGDVLAERRYAADVLSLSKDSRRESFARRIKEKTGLAAPLAMQHLTQIFGMFELSMSKTLAGNPVGDGEEFQNGCFLIDNADRMMRFLKTAWLKNDTRILSALKRNVGKIFSPSMEMIRILAPYLPSGTDAESENSRQMMCLVAGLVAIGDGKFGKFGNFGDTCKKLCSKSSRERQFIALLESRTSQLPSRLTSMVLFAKSESLWINWESLLLDILFWNNPGKKVQLNWAHSFWGRSWRKSGDAELESERK